MYTLSKLVWFVAAPSNALCLGVLAGLALGWSRFAGFGRGIAAICGVFLLIFGISPIGSAMMKPLEDRFPAYVHDGRPVDGIVVLGGALMSEPTLGRGRLELNEAAERLTALIDLVRRYPQARIVFTGGAGEFTGTPVPEADVLARHIGELLVEPKILYENKSRNTLENAVYAKVLASPRPGERWLLVTSAWHMPRSVGLFRKAGWEVTAYPVDYRTSATADDWRLNGTVSGGLRRVDVAAKEWVGLLFAWITGQSDALLPK